MATESITPLVKEEQAEDDDAWLYGDDAAGQDTMTEDVPADAVVGDSVTEAEATFDPSEDDYVPTEDAAVTSGGNENGDEDDEDEDDDDDDDDDDDIQVTIGAISTTPQFPFGSTAGPVNINITKRGPGVTATTTTAAKAKTANAIDLDAEGTFNGESIFDLNPDTLEDKPWRRPGADITDYFNYGFTEETWKVYCDRQRRIRNEATSGPGGPLLQPGIIGHQPHFRPPFIPRGPPPVMMGHHMPPAQFLHPSHHPSSSPLSSQGEQTISTVNSNLVNENSKYSSPAGLMMNRSRMMMMSGPPPGRRPTGAIDVIGSAAGPPGGQLPGIPSRRPDGSQENFITVLGPRPSMNLPHHVYGPPPGHPPAHFTPGVETGYSQGLPPLPGIMGNGSFPPQDFPGGPRFAMGPPPGHLIPDSTRGQFEEDDRGFRDRSPEQDFADTGYRSTRYSSDRGFRDEEYGRGRRDYDHYEGRERREYQPDRQLSPSADRLDTSSSNRSRDREESSSRSDSLTIKQEPQDEPSRSSSSSRNRSSGHHRSEGSSSSRGKSRDKDKDSDRDKGPSSSKRRHYDDESSSKSSRHKHSKRSRRDKDDDN